MFFYCFSYKIVIHKKKREYWIINYSVIYFLCMTIYLLSPSVTTSNEEVLLKKNDIANQWTSEQTNERTNKQTNEQTNERMNKRLDE